MAKDKSNEKFESALRVTSTIAGFRRGGIGHPAAEVTHPPGTFTQEQAEQILGEPALVTKALTEAEWKAHQGAEKKSGKGATDPSGPGAT